MDPLIVVAIISGGYTVIGSVLKIVEKYFPGKNSPSASPAEDREKRIDAKIEKHLERIEAEADAERQRHREELDGVRTEYERKMDTMRSDHEQLQALYLDAVERLESQNVAPMQQRPEA